MDEKTCSGVMFLKTAKEIEETLEEYENEKNILRVFELYDCLFTLKEDKMFVPEYYSALQGTLDKLQVYQTLVTDLNTLK